MYRIVLSANFKKELEKEVKGDLVLWKKVSKTLQNLSSDVNIPSLRLHKLSGRNNWSVSVNKSQRIIFSIEDDTIYCTKFGKHEDVY